MNPSTKAWDWLGKGIYFWQAAPIRAWIWKRFLAQPPRNRSSADETVVLEYPLTLDPIECLDLFDIEWTKLLGATGQSVRKEWQASGIDPAEMSSRLKRNAQFTGAHPHYLDCAVINQLCKRLEHHHRIQIRVVRAAFQHLSKVYPYASFRTGDHVQVAVRDPNLITVSNLREVPSLDQIEEEYRPRTRP